MLCFPVLVKVLIFRVYLLHSTITLEQSYVVVVRGILKQTVISCLNLKHQLAMQDSDCLFVY